MDRLIVNSHAFYDLIVQPHFSDLAANFNGYYSGSLQEFTVADEVPLAKGQTIIDLFAHQNILQRRGNSCKTNWTQLLNGSTRKIHVDELYGAVEDCQQEFYAGCLKDFRDKNPKFKQIVLDRFKKAIGTDIATNSYFGDITRSADPNGKWSWNKYDGIFTKYASYLGTNNAYTPQGLTAIPSGQISPANAYALFNSAFNAMTDEMRAGLVSDLGFYVDWGLAEALRDYYISIGQAAGNIGLMMNGIPVLDFKGIPIFVEPTWKPVLTALNGGTIAHAMVLTFRGNFIFGTNKGYGGGANLDQSLRIWFSEDDDVWRYKMYMAGGTELGSPQNTVIAMTNIA